jgi:hypothetical protein
MRPIWILSAVLLLALLGFFYSRDRMMGCDALESGQPSTWCAPMSTWSARAFVSPPIAG